MYFNFNFMSCHVMSCHAALLWAWCRVCLLDHLMIKPHHTVEIILDLPLWNEVLNPRTRILKSIGSNLIFSHFTSTCRFFLMLLILSLSHLNIFISPLFLHLFFSSSLLTFSHFFLFYPISPYNTPHQRRSSVVQIITATWRALYARENRRASRITPIRRRVVRGQAVISSRHTAKCRGIGTYAYVIEYCEIRWHPQQYFALILNLNSVIFNYRVHFTHFIFTKFIIVIVCIISHTVYRYLWSWTSLRIRSC
jgi:hypothetical protein